MADPIATAPGSDTTHVGDKTQAFESLNKAFSERDFLLVLLNIEPMFDPLRSDPRFAELSRRVGLPQ